MVKLKTKVIGLFVQFLETFINMIIRIFWHIDNKKRVKLSRVHFIVLRHLKITFWGTFKAVLLVGNKCRGRDSSNNQHCKHWCMERYLCHYSFIIWSKMSYLWMGWFACLWNLWNNMLKLNVSTFYILPWPCSNRVIYKTA